MNLQPIVALQIRWCHKIVVYLFHLFQLQTLQNEHSLHEEIDEVHFKIIHQQLAEGALSYV